ncbi:nodulation protein NodH [Tabrizicola sp.]|uniref:nodulation protein NodH n=1 Tax=Tabrizicola sp. TaxID=2005166 RepID=UPI001A5BD7D5|nr:nodulation protein NodH [Tabrizicola sp.]MBL9064245.1 nodulation protein NodH [Tabrizicola sp.]
MRRFHSFVVFAEMRTGSNLLEANLNALPGVVSHGEVFNRYILGKKDRTELFGITIEERDRDPRPLLRKLREETDGLPGFRFFHDHDLRILDDVLPDPACAKIILTRNPLESYVSWKIAQATDQWKLTNARRLKTAKVRFDVAEFLQHLQYIQAFQLTLLHALQTTGQTAFYLDYEDLGSLDVINGLAAFLGVEARLKALDDTLKKQNPGPLEDKLENPDALAEAIAAVDVFNLGRTPSFEPRRAAGVPTALASDAGLLFLPIRSGPEAAVRDWFAALGPVSEGFEQKSLRQWKRRHPGHRSFTVLRHPLLRAHAAFRQKIVMGEAPDLRRILINGFLAELQPPGEPFATAEAERAAFLIFLTYCRLAVGGQTGARVDPGLASQTALVQGFASFQPLDYLLREDRLVEGLANLAAEAGVAPPSITPDPAEAALLTIWEETLETAAADTYQRDYMGFGFTRWRK